MTAQIGPTGTINARNGDRQKMQTELEMEAGRKAVERYTAQPTVPPQKNNSTAPAIPFPSGETVDTSIVAAVPGKQPQTEGIERETPPGEQPEPNASQAKQSGGAELETPKDEIARFIARVVPWPENPDAAGYINLHWTFWDGDEPPKNPPWGGIPTKTVEEFMKALDWVRAQKNTRDIYFCLSLQSETRLNKRGRIVAARSKENAIGLKSIWLDIDVKEPPRGYATLRDAIDALTAFCKSTMLPPPTAMVLSGGGLHVYWASDKPLTPADWKPYAEGLKAVALKFGLKCDAGCTVNSACVLRVPGTFNFKKRSKRPVLLEPSDE